MTKVTSIGFDYGAMATRDGGAHRRLASCTSLVGPRPFGVHCKHRGLEGGSPGLFAVCTRYFSVVGAKLCTHFHSLNLLPQGLFKFF